MSISYHIFEKDGIHYKIYREPFESETYFFERGWYIVSKKPTNKKEFEESIRLSRIWSNVKFKKCEYSPDVMRLL